MSLRKLVTSIAVLAIASIAIGVGTHGYLNLLGRGAIANASSTTGRTREVASDAAKPHKSSWKPAFPRSSDATGKWYKVPANDPVAAGLMFEVTDGVVTGVSKDKGKPTQHDLLGTRYQRGDIDATDVTPELWRHLDITLEKPDRTVAKISLMRPLWWLEETGATVGGTIW